MVDKEAPLPMLLVEKKYLLDFLSCTIYTIFAQYTKYASSHVPSEQLEAVFDNINEQIELISLEVQQEPQLLNYNDFRSYRDRLTALDLSTEQILRDEQAPVIRRPMVPH